MMRVRILLGLALLVGCSVTSPGGPGGSTTLPPVGPLVISGGKSVSWSMTYDSWETVHEGSNGKPFTLSREAGSGVYSGVIPADGADAGHVLTLRTSGEWFVGGSFRSTAWNEGEGPELETFSVEASHDVGSQCPAEGMRLELDGYYSIGGTETFTADGFYRGFVTVVICDPAMAAVFRDGER